MNGLIAWLKGFKTPLQHVFVVHGEDTVTEEFAQKVEETLGCPTWAPFPNGEVDLAANEILNEGVRIAVKGKKHPRRKQTLHLSVLSQQEEDFWMLFTDEREFRIKTKQNLKVRSIILLINGIVGIVRKKKITDGRNLIRGFL